MGRDLETRERVKLYERRREGQGQAIGVPPENPRIKIMEK